MAAPELDDALLAAIAERRLALRVPVGFAVVVREGFRRLRAEVIDLSLTGCRLRFDEPITEDRRPWIWIPAGLGGRLPHPVQAEIAWTDSQPGAPTGHCQVGMRFRRFPFRAERRLERVLHALLARVARAEPALVEPEERRGDARAAYTRPVIARGGGTPRVLLGRDLSTGGLSVEARNGLAVGQRLQIALHAGGRTPLVLTAEVVRTGAGGAAGLRFRDLSPEQRQCIDRLLVELVGPQGAGENSLLVSQLPLAAEGGTPT